MIAVTVTGQSGSRVDINKERTVFADLSIALDNDFRRIRTPVPPRTNRRHAAPAIEARIPLIFRSEPPIARRVQPVPPRDRIPAAVLFGAFDFVMHFRFGHRGSEVVFGDDLRLNFFAQLHRLVGSFDFHFIFGLAIFFDDERTVADHVSLRLRDDFRHTVFFNGEGHHHFFGNPDYVSPQRSVRRYGPLAIDARPAICFCFDFVNDITLRISNLHPALLVRVAVVVRIKARLASPQAILDRMSRPIHRPVSNRIHLQRAVVQRLQCFRIPDVHKPVVCQPTLFRARNHDPLILRNQIFGIGRVQAIRICAGGKAAGKDFVVLILAILLSPPEELQVRTSDRRTGHGISHKIHGAVFHTLATDRSISHP